MFVVDPFREDISSPSAASRRQVAAFVSVAAVSAVAWLGWLGWHEQKHRVPGTSNIEGPYQSWQVIALIVTLVVAVGVASWLGFAKEAVIAGSIGTTAMFAADAATQPSPDADMWPAGAFLLLFGAVVGLGFVAILTNWIRRWTSKHDSR